MAKRAFRSQLIQKRLSLVESVRRYILAFEQVSEAALHFIFSKQDDLHCLTRKAAIDCQLIAVNQTIRDKPDGAGILIARTLSLHSIGRRDGCKSVVMRVAERGA